MHASLDLIVSIQSIGVWPGSAKHIYATFGAEELTELKIFKGIVSLGLSLCSQSSYAFCAVV